MKQTNWNSPYFFLPIFIFHHSNWILNREKAERQKSEKKKNILLIRFFHEFFIPPTTRALFFYSLVHPFFIYSNHPPFFIIPTFSHFPFSFSFLEKKESCEFFVHFSWLFRKSFSLFCCSFSSMFVWGKKMFFWLGLGGRFGRENEIGSEKFCIWYVPLYHHRIFCILSNQIWRNFTTSRISQSQPFSPSQSITHSKTLYIFLFICLS